MIETCKIENINLVIDADALWLLSNDEILTHVLRKNATLTSHSNIILTPNKIEYIRLSDRRSNEYLSFDDAPKVESISHSEIESHKILELSNSLGQCICLKGKCDIFSDGSKGRIFKISLIFKFMN